MKAIRIDVTNKTITKVDIGTKLQDLYDALECKVITAVFSQDPLIRDDMYVDDESLIKDLHDIPGGFTANFFRTQPLLGHGLIVSHDPETGEMINCKMTLKEARKQIKFLTNAEVKYFYNVLTSIPPSVVPF